VCLRSIPSLAPERLLPHFSVFCTPTAGLGMVAVALMASAGWGHCIGGSRGGSRATGLQGTLKDSHVGVLNRRERCFNGRRVEGNSYISL